MLRISQHCITDLSLLAKKSCPDERPLLRQARTGANRCHFWHERYLFDREELAQILDEIELEAIGSMFEDDASSPHAAR